MRVSVEVPFLGESIATMRILKWHKAAGAAVTERDPLVELTTDKIDFTIEAPASGELTEVRFGDDAEVHPQDVVAVITTRG